MTLFSSTSPIPKTTLRALTELTGEPRLNIALQLALQDAIAHRLAKINAAIQTLEEKYGMPFAQFQSLGEQEKLPDQFSFAVESDYLEWDGLVSRKKKLENMAQWLAHSSLR
jgi:hypothetical protein